MKNYIQKFICKGFILMAGASMVLTGCKESFLEPDPQTMFKPSEVFTTEDGISGFISITRIVVYSILVYLIIIGLTVVHIIVRIFIMPAIIGVDTIIFTIILRLIG